MGESSSLSDRSATGLVQVDGAMAGPGPALVDGVVRLREVQRAQEVPCKAGNVAWFSHLPEYCILNEYVDWTYQSVSIHESGHCGQLTVQMTRSELASWSLGTMRKETQGSLQKKGLFMQVHHAHL